MADLFLLFNHTITPIQEEQARLELGVERIIEPSAHIHSIWAGLPPGDEGLAPVLEPVVSWLDNEAVPGDYVLIQGDFGACFLMVRHALEKGLVPIYSTTNRQAVEKLMDDGSVQLTHRFRHVRFRQYGK